MRASDSVDTMCVIKINYSSNADSGSSPVAWADCRHGRFAPEYAISTTLARSNSRPTDP
jgi:hypothetical protein